MKKILGLICFITAVFIVFNIDYGNKVFEVENPCEIFIDSNKNLVFDEEEPFKLSNIYYINTNLDYKKYPILNELTDDEKFFLEYKAKETAQNLIKNRYVKIKDNDIFIQNLSYTDKIKESKFVFDDTEESQNLLVENIKKTNLDDYVILNLKNKKYHKLNCISGRKSTKYKIVKLSEIKDKSKKCKSCHLEKEEHKEITREKLPVFRFKNDVFSSQNIKIFFLDLNTIFKPDNNCNTQACKSLKNEIDKAKDTIDFAVYGINNQPKILAALVNAQTRGVKIRRVYDYSEKKYYEDNDKLDKIITTYMTDEQYDKSNSPSLMHNKYFIFDSKRIWTGSSNISSTDLSGFNANYAVLIESKELAKKYLEDFEQMYNGIFHKSKKKSDSEFIQINPQTKVKPLFSPQDNIIYSEIIPLINSSEKYIYMPVFFITNKGIEEALINAHFRGIDIKIITDATNANTKYSIHKRLRQSGIKAKTENYAGKMHAKTMIIDGKYSIIGSMNFTNSGNGRNDENLLIIENADIANYMKSTFMYLWNRIPKEYESFDPKSESLESVGSCFDGIDNDFDDKIDSADEGCLMSYKKNPS